MRLSVSAFILLSLAPSASAMAADTKLGPVIAIERSFKIDPSDCEKTYKIVTPALATCDVFVQAVDATDWTVKGAYAHLTRAEGQSGKFSVNVFSMNMGYSIQVIADEGSPDLSFAAIRGAIKELAASLPAQELKTIVYKIRR